MSNYIADSQEAVLRRKILGVKMRDARIKSGLNLKEVGEAIGMSAGLVSDVEFGRRDISLPHLEVMALLFNVPVVYFLSDIPIEENHRDFPTLQALALRQRIIGVLLRHVRPASARHRQHRGTTRTAR